uniref:Nif11-type n=1 Tax=Nostoc sp. PCC 9448 TaxID=2099384 RepID=A0A2P0ZGJ2_9NOSO|nr:Nif11-type precursor [Nostoc sp. PCC 9448]
MSLDNVRAFYERLATDEAFRTQIQGLESKEAGLEILQNTGYIFTVEEFEEYTANILETDVAETGLRDLDEKELEAVFGGVTSILKFPFLPILLYGVVITRVRSVF